MIHSFNKFNKYVKDSDIYESINMKSYHFNTGIDTIMVNAAMGMGKTKKLHGLFDNFEDKKIVIVSFRRTLDSEYARNFEGFELYQNLGNIYDTAIYNKIVIQIDSFYKIIGEIDLLVLDEFSYTMMHLIERAKNKDSNYNALYEYILNLDTKIIVMDALMDEYMVRWFYYQKRNIHYIENTYKKHTNIEIINYENKIGIFMEDIINNLKNGKKLIIPTNSKAFLKNLEKEIKLICPNTKIKFLNADNSDDIDLDSWDNYDIVGYTPTIVAGVSYEKNYFHKIFAYFTNNSSCAEMSLQQLFRVRNISDNQINLCIENKDNMKYLTKRKDIENYILEKNKCLIDGFMNVNISRIHRNIIKDSYFYLYLDCQLKINKSKNNYENILIDLLKKQGINNIKTILKIDLNLDKNARSSMRETSKIVNDDIINDVINADEIDDDQYKIMKNRTILNYKEKCILKKKKYRLTYGFDGVINFDDYKKYSKKYKQYENMNKVYTFKDDIFKYLEHHIQKTEDTKIVEHEAYENGRCNKNGKIILSPNPFILHQSKMNEKLIVGLDILNMLGAKDIFNKKSFKIDFNKVLNYIKKNEKIIKLLFKCKDFDFNIKLDKNGINEIIKYINSKLRTLFWIQIKKADKNGDEYILDGMNYWCEHINPFKENITLKEDFEIDVYVNMVLNNTDFDDI